MLRAVFAALLLAVALAKSPYDASVLGPMTGESLAVTFDQLLKVEGPEATLRISSPGGEAITTLLFIEYVTELKAMKGLHIKCVGTVMVASAAAILFESKVCDERVLKPATLILFHEASSSAQGKQRDAEEMASLLHNLNRAIAEIVAPRLQMSVDSYLDWISGHDRWLTDDIAVEMHVADRVED
jgi:ATP-dependent protease ClpP protease subunit